MKPYLPLLPLVSDRHVDAFTLAGTAAEVTAHAIELRKAGIDSFIIRPLAADGASAEEMVQAFGRDIWPAVMAASGREARVTFEVHQPESVAEAVRLAGQYGAFSCGRHRPHHTGRLRAPRTTASHRARQDRRAFRH